MNQIEIKEEPIDYDDIVNNKLQQQEIRTEAKDMHFIDIKDEQEDDKEQFNNFRILNEEDDIITLAPTADKSEDELNFIQLLNMFGEIKKRKISGVTNMPGQSKQVKFTECNNEYGTQDSNLSTKFESNLPNIQNKVLSPTTTATIGTYIKRETFDDQNEFNNYTIHDICSTGVINDIKIKDESIENDKEYTKASYSNSYNNLTPIPKIKIPASLFNSLKNSSSTNILHTNGDAVNLQKVQHPKLVLNATATKNVMNLNKPVATAVKSTNNILQPIKIRNNSIILKATSANPTATPNNIKILKLPPNTKIIKLDAKQSINNKIITASTPITSIRIKQSDHATQTYVVTTSLPNTATPAVVLQSPTAKTKSDSHLADYRKETEQLIKNRILASQKKQKSIHFVSKPVLNFIETLPESKKAIKELLQQVKNAETTSTVAQSAAMNEEQSITTDHGSTSTSLVEAKFSKSNAIDENNIKNLQTIEPLFDANDYSDSNSSSNFSARANVISDHDNIIQVVHMTLKDNDTQLAKVRKANANNRSFWLCPRCPRQYAQRSTMRQHLENYHCLDYHEIDNLLLEVRIIRIGTEGLKIDFSAINEMDNSIKAENTEVSQANITSLNTTNETRRGTVGTTTNFEILTSSNKKRRENYKYKCDKCGRRCSSKITLIDHIVANCSREPQYQCSQCPKKFYSVSTLNCHVTIHTGELPHKCDYCDKRFRTRGQVTVHHRTHTGERPFKCQVCSQCFTHRETLIAHLSRHIGMKRYKCYGCSKLFSCISGLRTHRETRPDTCGKVKFNPRALGPRVRVVKGTVIFEPQPEINPYLRSEEPPIVSSSE